MAPEQARGLAVDKRTDIWAFGVVVLRELAGGRPFEEHALRHTSRPCCARRDSTGRSYPDGTPHELRAAAALLERDPANRPTTSADARS